jgi:hypothetical protein
MRGVFKGGALFALVVVLSGPAVYADDPPGEADPPKVRIGPPIGVTAEEASPTVLELFWIWLQVRIEPPIG